MKRQRSGLMVLALLLALAAGCARERDAREEKKEEGAWRAKGTIVSVDAANGKIRVDHKDIPGLMGAMTMEFRLADAAVAEGFQAGEAVEFLLAERSRGLTVTEMRKISAAELERTEVGKTYTGRGRVKVVNRMAATVILEHDPIPGEMGAGELALPVKPPSLIEGIENGTRVEFTLTKTEQGLVVTSLEKR